MAVFSVTGILNGKKIKKEIDAPSERHLKIIADKENIFVLSFKEVKVKKASDLKLKVSRRDIIDFFIFLSTTLSGGLDIIQSLVLYTKEEKQATNLRPYILEALTAIKEEGISIPQAFEQIKIFDNFSLNIIQSGYISGNLESSLAKLIQYMETSQRIKSKVKKAMVYPSIVFVAVLVFLFIAVTFAIPVFAKILSSAGAPLPPITLGILAMSHFFKNYWIFIVPFFGGVVFSHLLFYKINRIYRKKAQRVLLKVPFIGEIYKLGVMAKFANNFAMLYSSGIDALETMRLSAKSVDSTLFEDALMEARDDIEDGSPITTALKKSELFTPVIVYLMEAGEASGTADVTMSKVSNYLDEEIPKRIDNFMAMLEPAITIFLVVVVGILAVGVLMPMFDLYSAVKT